ncbi:low-density lipoprotein receptor-related protein 8-like [Melanotaenia boesemani]|uniref:low-density lipoprotein receptor-related protein 8-like n=1 Tax=Melanotaenia boesemani TaxID=1250792 RepID=UPI001C046174|nr:low-density lipoprotein receptor-related protein 8-like [Melanotaenia boesemani]
MGHLVVLFLLISPLIYRHIRGHSLPVCHEQLGFRCGDGSCVSSLKTCDGRSDCKDGSDERHCGHVWCKNDEFACHSKQCISTKLLCDGVDDCDNGRDEDSCHNCTAGFFSCGPSGACLPRIKLCDGRTDCRDGRDETWEFCGLAKPMPQTSPACAVSEYHCGNGECIRHAWRCDHSPDCSDGSDEENCDQDECQVNNGGCSHYCVDQKMGFFCHCPDNMKLVDDSQCEEVDMCLEGDVCDQLCVHINGNLTCDCQEGYNRTPNAGECKAKGEEAQLVFTTSKGIQFNSLVNSENKVLAPHLPGPGPVAVVASNRTLYWAQHGQKSIYRISVDEKSQEAVLVLKVEGSVSGLAVDWIHRLLYWTSPERGSVNVALLDSSFQHQLVTGLDRPSAVAVDPLQGFLFWTQCGSSPKIQRASLNGSDRIDLVTSSVHQPVAVSLDMPRQLLYWFDQGMRSISRVNLEGRHRKTVVQSNGYLDRSFGLAVFEGYVYWAEEVTRSICRANKHNGRNFQVLLSNLTSPGGVAILQPALQPNGPSACGLPGVVCQHECAVDLLAKRLQFSCISPPAISSKTTSSTLSDTAFAGILSLIMFLSMLLVGMALWWWREECSSSRSFTVQSFSLKESQDPLISQEPPVGPNTFLGKETNA